MHTVIHDVFVIGTYFVLGTLSLGAVILSLKLLFMIGDLLLSYWFDFQYWLDERKKSTTITTLEWTREDKEALGKFLEGAKTGEIDCSQVKAVKIDTANIKFENNEFGWKQ
jgi:hypothetical protein